MPEQNITIHINSEADLKALEQTIAKYKELAAAGQQFAQAAQVFNNVKPPQAPTPAQQPVQPPGQNNPNHPSPKDPQKHLGFWESLKEKVNEAQHAFHAAGGGLSGVMEVMEMMAKNTTLRLLLGLSAVAGVAEKALHKFSELETSVTKLDAALANHGLLTDDYRDKLQKLANEMQDVTNVANDRWLAAFAKLTQFGADDSNINKYAEAVKNLAGFMGGDVEAAANIFGRAIEGNGYMLARFGIHVDHTKTKTEQLDEIMKQLATRGGGALEAQTKTIAGEFTNFKLKVNDLWVGLGNMISRTELVQGAFRTLSVAMGAWAKIFPETVKQVDGLSNRLGGELNKGLKDIGINIQKQLADPLGKVSNLDTIHGKLQQILHDYKLITDEEHDQFDAEKQIAEAVIDREITILRVQKLEAVAAAKTAQDKTNIEQDYDNRILEMEDAKTQKTLEIQRRELEAKKAAIDELIKKETDLQKQINELEEKRAKDQERLGVPGEEFSQRLEGLVGIKVDKLPPDQRTSENIGALIQNQIKTQKEALNASQSEYDVRQATYEASGGIGKLGDAKQKELAGKIAEASGKVLILEGLLGKVSEFLTTLYDAEGLKQLKESFDVNSKDITKARRAEETARRVFELKDSTEREKAEEHKAEAEKKTREAAVKGYEAAYTHLETISAELNNQLQKGEVRYSKIYGDNVANPNDFIQGAGIEVAKQFVDMRLSFGKVQELLAQYQATIDPAEQDRLRKELVDEETKVRDAYNKVWKDAEGNRVKQAQIQATIYPALQAYLDILTGPKRNKQQIQQDFQRQGLNEPADINALIKKLAGSDGALGALFKKGLTSTPLPVPNTNIPPVPVVVKKVDVDPFTLPGHHDPNPFNLPGDKSSDDKGHFPIDAERVGILRERGYTKEEINRLFERRGSTADGVEAFKKAFEQKEHLETKVRPPGQKFGSTATPEQKEAIDRIDAQEKAIRERDAARRRQLDEEAAGKLKAAADALQKAAGGTTPNQGSGVGDLAGAFAGFSQATTDKLDDVTKQLNGLTKQVARLKTQE